MQAEKVNELCEKYGAYLSRFCMSLCRNKHDAADLYQDTWMKILRSKKDFDDDEHFKNYLLKICVNRYRDMCRTIIRHKECCLSDEKAEYIESIPDSADERSDYFDLYDAIAKLPAKYRTVIVLTYFKDSDIKTAAQILSLPEGTVKSRLFRGKEMLRKELCEKNEA